MTNREIDALVAEKVMGWSYEAQRVIWGERERAKWIKSNGREVETFELPNYSTVITEAWEAVEQLQRENIYLRMYTCPNGFAVEWFLGEEEKFVKMVNPPEAICLAALKAKGVEVA